jgi:hypothetical protein
MVSEPLLTHDVAHVIGRSPGRVRQLVAEHKLEPALRTPGGVAIFDRGDVEAWMERRESREGTS